ncbi:MATE efflux family protein [Sulfitobacter noctilucicola]|uniref:Multidrug-efflux transporter n=1 Tax=Sulfitobacter noctilucicola TaxID=1342301 RepID=A0A7W6M9A2_9RHOB|nr:MATE family efflux transporter [Sulfitobacter noctilucicola]KIN64388.1 MATE efflux family protein [Sulfitobacter noctilucicola]MBB4174453.1 MATE family multidrug resistance protein [Sulfitobacter noctilucicola]
MTPSMTYPGHVRAILRLGLPLIGGHLGQIAIGVTDTVMVGWYSIEALAAVTLSSTYFFVLFIFGSGFAWAVMPMVATFVAEEDEVSIRRATRMGLWLSIGFAVLALPLLLFSEPILKLLGQGDALAAEAVRYLQVAGWGILPALLVMVLKSYLAALERTQVVLWITLVAAVVNAFANYAFIFGNFGAPELGIVGAATASVLTHTVSLIGVVIYILWVVPQHQLFVRFWRADRQMLARVFKLGWPISVTSLSEVGLFAASAVMMGWLGVIPLAAHGIAIQLASITFMVHVGLSNVATIRSGNAHGRRDRPHMGRGAVVVTVMSVVVALLTTVAFVGWPEALISIFMQDGEPARVEILAIGVGLLAMAALFQLVDGLQVIALGLLRGVQDTAIPMWMAAFSYWVVGIPCSYLLGFVLGFDGIGVWAGLVIGLGIAAVLLNLRFWGFTMRGPQERN